MLCDILDSAQLQHGDLKLSVHTFDLKDLLEECVLATQLLFGNPQLSVTYSGPSSLEVSTDSARLKRVLMNLLARSGRATQEGYIRLAARNETDLVLIKISDSGQKVSEIANASRLFLSGVDRVQDGQPENGVSLGLSTAQDLIGLLGPTCSIDYSNSETVGNSLSFYIYKELKTRNISDLAGSPQAHEPALKVVFFHQAKSV